MPSLSGTALADSICSTRVRSTLRIWQSAITSICRAFGGEGAALTLQDVGTQQVRSGIYVDIDGQYQNKYALLTSQPDMLGAIRVLGASSSQGAITGDAIASAAPDFARSRFHDEWLRALRLANFVAVPLVPTRSLVGGMFIGRPRRTGGFGRRDLDALRLLRPHLLRALQLRHRLQGLETAVQDAREVLDVIQTAVILVDSGATIMHANRAAETIIARGDGVCTTRSALCCEHSDDTSRLRQLIGEASAVPTRGSGGALAIRRRSGRRPLSALVTPVRGERPRTAEPSTTAIVLIADPEAAIPDLGAGLRAVYGLTAGEARVAVALLKHERLADVAAALGVRLATVRTLLQRAFEKTNTHRQAELVRLMLSQQMP